MKVRFLLSAVVLAAAAAPLLATREAAGADASPAMRALAPVAAAVLALAAAAAAIAQAVPGLLPGIRIRPWTRRSAAPPPGPAAAALLAIAVAASVASAAVLALLGARAALVLPPLLLVAGYRGLRRAKPARDLGALRDAALAAFAMLAFDGGAASVIGAAAVTVLAAAALPGIQAARAARAASLLDGGPAGRAPSLRTAGIAAPTTAILAAVVFLLLPRAWPGAPPEQGAASERRRERDAREGTHPPGLSLAETPHRTVSIGDIGRLQRDFRPILEIEVLRGGRPADAEDMGALFRSGALESFDGLAWEATDRRGRVLSDGSDGKPDGWVTLPRRRLPPWEPVEQRVRFLAGGSDALFCLGMPVAVGGPGARNGVLLVGRGEVRSRETYREGEEFHLRSHALPGEHSLVDAEVLPDDRRARLLFVPPGHEEAAALAATALGPDARGRSALRRLEAFLTRRCAYSLDIAAPGARSPVEAFLFQSRRGHCELFASSAAVMLRAAGIPARVVIGFRGGVFDPVAMKYTVRGADAHAWVEAHLEGEGWVSFDPTPAAPGEPPAAAVDPGEAGEGGAWANGVLGFDGGRQREFVLGAVELLGTAASRTLFDASGRPRVAGIAVLLAAVALLLGAQLLRGRIGGPRAAPAAPRIDAGPPPESWAAFLEVLSSRGIRRGPAETPRELADRAAAAGIRPAGAPERLADAYALERWGGRAADPAERDGLLALARSLSFPQ